MVILSDFSGQHKNSHFETYSFLFLDPHQNSDWFSKQVQFRANGSLENRRMSFKSMNDIKRRDALLPFLSMANFVEGCLVTFAISKNGQSLFASSLEPRGEDILSSWKLKTREHVMRIVHLGAYLAAAFSRPMQNLIWIIDEDDAAANDQQLKQLTNVFGHMMNHYLSHDLKHVRCGTSRSDNGALQLEDLLAITDLAAGTMAEISTAFANENTFPGKGAITPLTKKLSEKSRLIAAWLNYSESKLQREHFIFRLNADSKGIELTHMKFHAQI